jgi:hypothetical protein
MQNYFTKYSATTSSPYKPRACITSEGRSRILIFYHRHFLCCFTHPPTSFRSLNSWERERFLNSVLSVYVINFNVFIHNASVTKEIQILGWGKKLQTSISSKNFGFNVWAALNTRRRPTYRQTMQLPSSGRWTTHNIQSCSHSKAEVLHWTPAEKI